VSAHDALQMIDAKVESLREGGHPILGKQAVIDILLVIRNGLTRDPDWSEVHEANLRAELARVREDALQAQLTTDVAASIYDMTIAGLRRQLESARRIAVALEQENAEEIGDPADYEPCPAEIHSWKLFSPSAVDSYYLRCHLLGPHKEHENSETGGTWTDPEIPA
jgi:hypothetical protein